MLNMEMYRDVYFAFDLPVPYTLSCGEIINIIPIQLKDFAVYNIAVQSLCIDKDTYGTVEEIQMSYLEYIYHKALLDKSGVLQQKFLTICRLCMGFDFPVLYLEHKKPKLVNIVLNENGERIEKYSITASEFDDIKRIILYQNYPNYDDEYIDPNFKKNMEEYDELQARGKEMPNLERRIGIITAHTGIPKKQQIEMTLREHLTLFNEVKGEVEYSAIKGVACFGGNSEDIQWIYQRKSGKFDRYTTSISDYNKSMGGDGNVPEIII